MAARRAADGDALLAASDLIEDEGDKISIAALVKQGVTAVLVSCLALFVVGAGRAVSAPYSTGVSTHGAAISGSGDVTRGQPSTPPDQTDTTSEATADTTGTDADLSRSAVRSELTNAVAAQQESARGMALADTAAQVSEAAQTAAADQRAAALSLTNSAISTAAQRIADAAARAAAEKKLGTLATSTSAKQPVAIGPSILAALATIDASAPWVPPIAVGSYTRGAVFGAYGVWSRYHTGVDLVAPYGTPIRATGSGVVLAADGGSWAGTHVVILQADGGRTLYAHMSAKAVQPGTVVKAGQLIGYVGMTGRAFGYHLHFEYYPPSATVGDPYTATDPLPFLLRHGVTI